MAASVDNYLNIVGKAFQGQLKLPAFQRDWKWKQNQVVLLFDSLRQGFPIGSFLFIQSNPTVDLAPRAFRGALEMAEDAQADDLVLDGQQRITAGLELFYGQGSRHYFIDLKRLKELVKERNVDPNDKAAVRKFLADLDAEDGYCVSSKATNDPEAYLLKSDKMWTGLMLDDDELERAIGRYAKAYPDDHDFIRYLVGRNFRPAQPNNIPITTIPGNVTVEAISRIFSTLNSTGKLLTPFELVVSILYPQKVNLAADVAVLREMYPYYAKIDRTGDLLLITIALFDGKETRKASLPKTITVESYQKHHEGAAEFLNESARIISERVGLGLDESDELLVYPVIFPPAAFVLKQLQGMGLDHQQRAEALGRMEKWFVGAVLSRRYQQSTHDKQAKDKVEMLTWLAGSEGDMPAWLNETYIVNLRGADPSGAAGKLLQSLMNSKAISDPLTNLPVGVGSGKRTSSKHHIFPSRFVPSIKGWDKQKDKADLALNIMFVEESTNSSFLHLDPAAQIQKAIGALGSESKARDVYLAHGITSKAFDILAKPNKTRDDFYNFIAEREAFFVGILEQYGFTRPAGPASVDPDDEDA